MEKSRKLSSNRAITLIALIITIIVMLILVVVSVRIALNTGLFESAGKATGNWQTAQEKEQELAGGQVTIGNKTYNSIEEYVNEKPKVDISNIKVGDYISNYPVQYNNVVCWIWDNSKGSQAEIYPSDEYTGWRVLSIETDEEGKKYLRLISAGIPLNYYRPYTEAGANETYNDFTTEFLTTSIGNNNREFWNCGFDVGDSTTLGNIFVNDFTISAQALVKEDIDKILGKEVEAGETLNEDELMQLLTVPAEGEYSEKFVPIWLGTVGVNQGSNWCAYSDGTIGQDMEGTYGVRPVVTLMPDIVFREADEKINNTATWEISL